VAAVVVVGVEAVAVVGVEAVAVVGVEAVHSGRRGQGRPIWKRMGWISFRTDWIWRRRERRRWKATEAAGESDCGG
jgi:hypothetical protein